MGVDYPILQHGQGVAAQAQGLNTLMGQAGALQGGAGGRGQAQAMGGLINWLPEPRALPTTKLEKIFYDAETERLNSFWGVRSDQINQSNNQIGQIITYTGKLPQYGP